MNFLPIDLEKYVEDHSQSEPVLLQQLSHETWQKIIQPRMLSGHIQGRFLSILSKLIRPIRILEIGTYTGYSALCLAEGLPENGTLLTIDINDELQWIQDKYFGLSPMGKKIHRQFGDAMKIIPTLDMNFDLVFIDADKENYLNYYEMLVSKLPPGACILIDNVLWSGKVLTEPAPNDIETKVIKELNQKITNDDRVENVLLPLRDGVMVLRVKH